MKPNRELHNIPELRIVRRLILIFMKLDIVSALDRLEMGSSLKATLDLLFNPEYTEHE